MNGLGLTFGGGRLPWLRVIDKEIARNASITRKRTKIPGRPGEVSNGFTTESRPIKITLDFEASSKREWLNRLDEALAFFIREKPAELIFDIEPDRMYKAEFEGTVETKEIGIYGQAILNFSCSDPYVYKDSETTTFLEGAATVFNDGSVDTPPIYELTVLEPITHLDIISDKHYLRLGEPAPIEEPTFYRQTLILNHDMKTMTGWTDPTTIDNGYIGGVMAATQAGFEATSFGAALKPHKWQGPAKQISLAQPVQNFRIDVPIELLNVSKETGMIEVYMLDAQGKTVAKIGMEDIWPTIKKNQAKFQLGEVTDRKVDYRREADYARAWNDFKGMIRLHRDGNLFRPYFGLVNSKGVHSWVSQAWTYRDVEGKYLAPITQIKVAIRKWPGTSTSQADMRIKGVKVWRYNDRDSGGVEYIAEAGDKIIIDVANNSVLLNGEEREDLKDWFSDFFNVDIGNTTLLLQPYDKLAGKVTIRERYR